MRVAEEENRVNPSEVEGKAGLTFDRFNDFLDGVAEAPPPIDHAEPNLFGGDFVPHQEVPQPPQAAQGVPQEPLHLQPNQVGFEFIAPGLVVT